MGYSPGERLRAEFEEGKRWLEDRKRQVAHRAEDLEARGREVYAHAIRTGQTVLARTPSELRALGLAAVTGQLPTTLTGIAVRRAAPVVKQLTADLKDPGKRARLVENARQQGRAAASGAADEASFGLADKAFAAGGALRDGGLESFGDRYRENMATKASEDAYDERNYGLARGAGRVAGFAADLAVAGAPGLAARVASFVPRGAEVLKALTTSKYLLDPRGLNVMAATGGGVMGLASQVASDTLRGQRSSLGDYAGAALGGSVDGLITLRRGPLVGGAVGGGAATAAQDMLSGRSPDLNHVLGSAKFSGALGGAGGVAGTVWAHSLSPGAKGDVGELFSAVKTLARGDVPTKFGKKFKLAGDGHTFTDLQFKPRTPGKEFGIGEAKMGPTATLSPRQLQASRQPNVDYVVDGWRFSDVGKAIGAGWTPFGVLFDDRDEPAWRSR